MRAIHAKQLVAADRMVEDQVLVYDRRIEKIESAAEFDFSTCESVLETEYLLPGFIDVHIHGSAGADVMDATPEAIATIAAAITQSGTTSFLPTTMTMPEERICAALEVIRSCRRAQAEAREYSGARILGAHLEGPFISAAKKGAQAAEYIQKPNDRWLKHYYDVVKLITMAPEEDEGFEMIRRFKAAGIVVSLGHSQADYACACSAYEAGARHITHLFNAMTPLHHRDPGLAGAGLLQDFNVELIADGFHLHPDIIRLTSRMKREEQLLLVTDCIRAGFMGEGPSELGGQRVFVEGDHCLLEDGTIAGSILRLDRALRNVLKFTGLELPQVVRMLSLNP
ncbi:MAG: N-acetylglucosamine-6-phosphate deacetylase, partial [Eubacteriales bacterium]|nr:N-acetylglucosamine-6-phosphate deacetylase [Eubacteriales bacterium]